MKEVAVTFVKVSTVAFAAEIATVDRPAATMKTAVESAANFLNMCVLLSQNVPADQPIERNSGFRLWTKGTELWSMSPRKTLEVAHYLSHDSTNELVPIVIVHVAGCDVIDRAA